MKKYQFLIFHKEYKPFLEELQQLGVVHIIEKEVPPEGELQESLTIIRHFDNTIRFLKQRKQPHREQNAPRDGLKMFKRIDETREELDARKQELASLRKELLRVEPWGDFDHSLIKKLQQEANISTRFFLCPAKQFRKEWAEQCHLQMINRLGTMVYFVVFQAAGQTIDIQADEVKLPLMDYSEMAGLRKEQEAQVAALNERLDDFAAESIPLLEHTRNSLLQKADLEKAKMSGDRQVAEKVMLLEGWAPQPKQEALHAFLDDKHIVYNSAKPKPSDRVPVLLQNNRLSHLFEPIGKLFSLPAYAEIDLTAFFAPFFMMFFGFCLGDAGYGFVWLLAATILKFFLSEKVKPFLTLGQLFGLATIFFGALTGTVFGLELPKLEAFSGIREHFLTYDHMFQLALLLGVVQILFGMGLRAVNRIRQFGWKYALSTFGWILLVLSLLDLFLLEVALPISGITVYAGIALIVFFNDPDAKIWVSMGKGLWDLYNITGFFGDVLSYIRLFALGVSSAILGLVINEIGLQIKDAAPVIGPILFVLFLVVGHTSNLLLASLSAFVHPLRLTFVEFYKNAGFKGSGMVYQPLKTRNGEQETA